MMGNETPSKADINTIFKKHRSIPSNKVCFDCGAKNPTWASVTYGIFICIDCSAIHRGLGVHLSFVRSTQLDTNWTWLQLRAMQVGGNSNATQFFSQHGCVSQDSQEKYKSRAAQLYKEKLHHLAAAAMRLHGYKPLIDAPHISEPISPDPREKKATDFFDEHTKEEFEAGFKPIGPTMPRNVSQTSVSEDAYIGHHNTNQNIVEDDGKEPSVDHLHTIDSSNATAEKVTKPVIGQKKPSTKKGGFGAQKVTKNFSQMEKEAENLEKMKLSNLNFVPDKKENVEAANAGLSSRLLVQDFTKETDKLKTADPKKYEQVDRLGMGFQQAGKKTVSHSATRDIQSISQEGERFNNSSSSNTTSSNGASSALLVFDLKSSSPIIEDDWQMVGNDLKEKSTNDFFDSFTTPTNKSKTSWGDDKREEKQKAKAASAAYASNEDAVKKFGNAKAISSDQYFGDRGSECQSRSTNMNRFEGQTSISSAQYFGDDSSSSGGGSNEANASKSASSYYTGGYTNFATPDVSEIKDSVRQGVTKVAGKLSQLSSSVSSYISSRRS